MEYLYVCLFSNGHIKVGRSNRPGERIEQHRDRVSCVGIELLKSESFACVDSEEREQGLINRCVSAASERFASEWFAGLNFYDVCQWARECARGEMKGPETIWVDVIRTLRKAGLTQVAIAERVGISTSNLSRLALGQQAEPFYSVGKKLLALQAEFAAAEAA